MAKAKAVLQPGVSRKAGAEGKVEGTPPLTDPQIVSILEGYRQEAENARKSGFNPRDDKWQENWNTYWNRFNWSDKAAWQAKETLAEVPSYVDRFAAAMKDALLSSPTGFYTVADPADKEKDLTPAIKRMEDVWLSRCGRNVSGDPLGFSAVFEEQMKMGSIAACCAVTLWKEDVPEGRVAVETVDPRRVWLDHTYRGLYRVRRTEIDRHELWRMAKEMDGEGKPLFHLPEIERLLGVLTDQERRWMEEASGTGQEVTSLRQPVILDEYYADILGMDGKVAFDRSLAVVANAQFLLRRPEPNPFWHKKDWLLYAPLVPVPLSPYGRSYMEDFGSIARTFNELTNMILDAVHTSSLKAFAVVPTMLMKPEQLNTGISPNKTFLLEEGARAEDFIKEIDLGTVSPDAIRLWQAIKGELTEAAKQNEIGIGQFAPNSRTSATEIERTQQSTSAMIKSIADVVETTFLNPLLDLVWKTGLQHAKPSDPLLMEAAGRDLYPVLLQNRRALAGGRLTFQAQGISRLIERTSTLRSLIQLLQLIAGSDVLLAEFLKIVDIGSLVRLLFELSAIDLSRLQSTERDNMLRGVGEQIAQAGQGAQARSGGREANPVQRAVAGDAAQTVQALLGQR